jgi:hypothetical protein
MSTPSPSDSFAFLDELRQHLQRRYGNDYILDNVDIKREESGRLVAAGVVFSRSENHGLIFGYEAGRDAQELAAAGANSAAGASIGS